MMKAIPLQNASKGLASAEALGIKLSNAVSLKHGR
jgi:hypothetical protein